MAENLKEKAVKGISWNLIERIGVQGIKFILGIILARLLMPADFGLIGMITVFFAIAQVFVQSGFGHAYIQKEHVDEKDANTVFYVNLITSVLLYFVLWFGAEAIANFYDQPQLVSLTRVMGIIVIINSFNVIQIAKITRNVDFKKKTQVTLIATIISGFAGIYAAYKGMGVWSLVIQHLSNAFIFSIILWVKSKWVPSLSFSRQSFKSLFSFGSWILAGGLLRTTFDNIYILIIGKLFPIAQLGFYTKAKQFQKLLSEQLSQATSSVAFPVFSKMQNDKVKLQRVMKDFLTHTMFLIAPVLIVVIVIAKPLVIVLLTDKWEPMIPYLQLLSVVGVLYPLHAVNVQALNAQGLSRLNFKLNLVKNALRVINIVITYRWGVLYIIIGEIVLSLIALFINTYFTKRLLNYGLFDQLLDIKELILGILLAGSLSYGFVLITANIYLALIIGAVLFGILFLGTQYVFNRRFLLSFIDLRKIFIKSGKK